MGSQNNMSLNLSWDYFFFNSWHCMIIDGLFIVHWNINNNSHNDVDFNKYLIHVLWEKSFMLLYAHCNNWMYNIRNTSVFVNEWISEWNNWIMKNCVNRSFFLCFKRIVMLHKLLDFFLRLHLSMPHYYYIFYHFYFVSFEIKQTAQINNL
jgi:hypothetical protein